MTTYRSKKLVPRLATTEEAIDIQRVLDLREERKKNYEEEEKLLDELVMTEPLVSKAKTYNKDHSAKIELMTFIVDRPDWIVTKAVHRAFEMKAKTTKEDMKTLGIK